MLFRYTVSRVLRKARCIQDTSGISWRRIAGLPTLASMSHRAPADIGRGLWRGIPRGSACSQAARRKRRQPRSTCTSPRQSPSQTRARHLALCSHSPPSWERLTHKQLLRQRIVKLLFSAATGPVRSLAGEREESVPAPGRSSDYKGPALHFIVRHNSVFCTAKMI